MNPIKISLKLAKANFKAAKARGDAAAARRYLEEIADLRGKRKGQKAVSTPVTYKAKCPKPKKRTKIEKRIREINREAENAAKLSRRPEDVELSEVRWLRRELDAPRAETRRNALEKLRRMLSDDELADVLTTNDPSEIVRKSGPSGRSAKAGAEQSLGWMVNRLADRSLPAATRNEIVDRLTKAAATDPRATDALAQIVGKVR